MANCGPMSAPSELSELTSADYPASVELINRNYRGEAALRSWSSEAWLLSGQRLDLGMMEEMLSHPERKLLGIKDADKLIACVLVEQKEAKLAYLGMLTVDLELQNQGLGAKLLAEAERWVMKHWKSNRITMNVITKRVELLAWYERRGYVKTGVRTPFFYGDSRFGNPKFPDLEFDELVKNLTSADYRPE